MLRHLYLSVLRLHPPGFRKRFAGEMLFIFDQEQGNRGAARLIIDGFVSLGRQWALRRKFWFDIHPARSLQPSSTGVPSFATLDPFRPASAAMVHGALLSIALFCLTCFAIRYSWIHVLQIHIPQIEFEKRSPLHPAASPSQLRGVAAGSSPSKVDSLSGSTSSLESLPAHLYVEPLPVEAEAPASSSTTDKVSLHGILAASGRPARVTFAAEIDLKSYVGVYVSRSPLHKVTIDVQNGNLVMSLDDQSMQMLSPLSETVFSVEQATGGEIEFAQGTDGTFNRLQLRLEGQRIVALRQ